MVRYCSLLLAVVLCAGAAFGQSSTAGDIEGTVTDSAGGAIGGASLKVVNQNTGLARLGQANSLGRYRLAALPAGQYDLQVTHPGFATVERKGLLIQVGQVATIDVTLPVASQVEHITVTEAAPIIEPGRSTVGQVVNRSEIDNLPINGRAFLDFARSVPGVTAQQDSGQGSGLSINGQRGRSNNISVDGADNNGQLNGTVRLTMSQDAVQEFQVVTEQFAPEFGNALGGVVNVISKSGANGLHGSAFLFARDEALDGRQAFNRDAEKPPFRRRTFGGTLGGPIVRNRTFFFGSVDYTRADQTGNVTLSDATVAAINQVLAARPIPNASVKSISTGSYPVGNLQTLASLKVDHSIDPNNTLTFRYLFGQGRESNSGGVAIGGATDVSGGGGRRRRDQSLVSSWTHIFSPTWLSETRFQFAPRNEIQYANDPQGPRVSVSGVASWGRSPSFPVLLDEMRYQGQQTFSKQYGRHYFKFGADINRVNAHTSFPSTFSGQFSFGGLAEFRAGTVTSFVQGFGDPEIHLPETMLGLYWQDTFKVSDHLSFTYGLRYDYDMQPQGLKRDLTNPIQANLQTGVNRDPNNVAPRFALTYNPDGSGRTVIRAGYGIFYDKIFLLVARNALIARQSITLTGATANAQLANGAFPESSSVPGGIALPKPNLSINDSNIRIPYSQQANFGVERALGRNWAVGVNYVFIRGVHLLRAQNINLPPPTVLTAANAVSLGVARPTVQQLGRPYYGSARLNPNFTEIQMVGSSSSSVYSGAQFNISKRFSHGFQMRASYALSRSLDDSGDFVQGQQPSDPYNARAEWGLSEEHQKQRLTISGVYDFPLKAKGGAPLHMIFGDWVFSTLWTFRSGVPDNAVVGSDVNGDGNSSTDRPYLGQYEIGRNTVLGAESEVIDVRLSRRIRFRDRFTMQILGEAFNVQNRVNYTSRNTTWGTDAAPRATYGIFQNSAAPRQMQLGLKLFF